MSQSKPQPTYQNIALDKVKVHPDLQRPINESWVKRIMKAWNADAFGMPIVAVNLQEQGGYWIVSGQHRIEAARRLGMSHVFCLVMSESSEEAMARVYIDEQTQREQHPLVKHRIALAANVPTAVGAQDVCDELGYVIPTGKTAKSSGRGVIQAIKPLYLLYDRGDLREVLTIIDMAFDKEYLACQGWALSSFGTFLLHVARYRKANPAAYDRDRFVANLRREGIAAIYGRYAARKQADSVVSNIAGAGVLVDVYNRGRRVGRLPMIDSYATEVTRAA